jgi:RNA-directed DNA polymerase
VDAPPPHLYQREARKRGVDPQTIGRAIQVARAIAGHGATPVFTLRHLAALTGASYFYLRDIVARRRDPYVSISRPKKDGRTRAISSPEPVLMDVQRWILRRVLAACTPDSSSFAYQRDRSIVDCAQAHVGARWLVKLDIHDFFPSIREQRVFPVFADLGYPRLLSLELTRLCTRVAWPVPQLTRFGRYQDKAPYYVYELGHLPQGAPTSGALANLAMKDVDRKLATYADEHGLVFTRYSDDIVLSSTGDFSREQASAVIARGAQILKDHRLSIHRAKTRVITPGARKIVLGLLVDGDRPRLLPEFKRRLEVHVRGVEKFGLPEHATHRHFDSILSMVNHVDGCIAFAASVDKNYAQKVAEEWALVLRARGYPR